MKTFLKHLKKELIKRHFSTSEIEEILADHQEMIETAQNDGLTDEELVMKFGDPEQLAKDLYDNRVETPILKGGIKVEGYELANSFPVIDKEFDSKIHLVSEDVKYMIHDQETIEVHYKNVKDLELYTIAFKDNQFLLQRKSEIGKFNFRKESAKFIVKVPVGIVNNVFEVHLVSGDAKLEGLQTNELTIRTTSGDVKIHSFKAQDTTVNTVSGDVKLSEGTMASATLSMVSGDIEANNVTCEGEVDANTVSGDLKAEESYFGPFSFKTVSGDCKGKNFYPKSISFRSVSGDVKIQNEDKDFNIEVLRKKSLSGSVKIK
jgi:DUF4097 and DUF4098 domain-containing protein YvlB